MPTDNLDIESEENYLAVVNAEGQYSIWLASQPIPAGWVQAVQGTRDECLAFIDRTWVDMRPLSLRQRVTAADAERLETEGAKQR
ncbi:MULTISPECIES: MbtH family protein [Pseudomonas syringae group]|uniref:MbtH family protein n=1 Tax=Pseudomonas syringae group TaxID=136849 RepID=UPI000CD327D4|nr:MULTISPECIES: MbtH family NRPS accessory protein [Pseudomonas syringae group]MBS7422906.1 MbtH family NRPS accessory protein [Pseudomonas syringae]MBS7434643.1 MbtH family NRPS accessory protein [Pseudomonas syringae]MCF5737155.1 MbtH family NRPS accessory protein [Pseudomonas syringae]MCF5742685.1 MbtH family NRPS accessory protein [Pseudomonas syringae]MCF5753046.1 MbtH family NRPS accessory protein [Pseudomonas syringae]